MLDVCVCEHVSWSLQNLQLY